MNVKLCQVAVNFKIQELGYMNENIKECRKKLK